MYGNRDQIRTQFVDAWHKAQAGETLTDLEQQLVDVISEHPEYHEYIKDRETALTGEFPPELGTSNPFLHMAMHLSLRDQARTDRPAGIQAAHASLCARFGVMDAEHRMMECLGQALWEAQRNNVAPDQNAYLECIQRLAAR
ncbi:MULTISPECIES: DUF1841 family protein [unclassified Thioalkalivibrio]|uniref:DUF1841 family protein n=1 Tax=unclassified Thioalkalivibrio TaxID=2621013 RepID=UPI0003825384|nr:MULTISPECIES: DUF1841 family protein [unclassified Thioalkalivibrio]